MLTNLTTSCYTTLHVFCWEALNSGHLTQRPAQAQRIIRDRDHLIYCGKHGASHTGVKIKLPSQLSVFQSERLPLLPDPATRVSCCVTGLTHRAQWLWNGASDLLWSSAEKGNPLRMVSKWWWHQIGVPLFPSVPCWMPNHDSSSSIWDLAPRTAKFLQLNLHLGFFPTKEVIILGSLLIPLYNHWNYTEEQRRFKAFLSSPGTPAFLWFSLLPIGLFSSQSIPLLCGFLLTNNQTHTKKVEFSYQMYAKKLVTSYISQIFTRKTNSIRFERKCRLR